MAKKIKFDSDGEEIEEVENDMVEVSEDLLQEQSDEDEIEESDDVVEEKSINHYDRFNSDSDDDDAPEEVTTSSSKAHMMDIYKMQKEVASVYALCILLLSNRTRKRKRKARTNRKEEEIDMEMLELLAKNSYFVFSLFNVLIFPHSRVYTSKGGRNA